MLTSFQQFFYMGGYGFYIWLAYAAAGLMLGILWFLPWYRFRRFRQRLKQQRHEPAHE